MPHFSTLLNRNKAHQGKRKIIANKWTSISTEALDSQTANCGKSNKFMVFLNEKKSLEIFYLLETSTSSKKITQIYDAVF